MMSSRRIWLGLTLCLLGMLAVLIPLLRNHVAQFSVGILTGADVEFSKINLHRSAQLVELQNVRTRVSKDGLEGRLQADRLIFKVDLPQLLDKKLIAPRARIDNLNIQLSEPATARHKLTVASQADSWQTSLNALMQSLQWEKIQSECDSLLAAEDMLQELDAKIQRWLVRSQQIVLHATQLTQSIQLLANPLRERGEVYRQLQTLEELTLEQAAFESQLPQLETLLAEKLAELESTHDKDVERLRKQVGRKGDAVRAAAATELVLDWATQLWSEQACFGQAASLLSTEPSSDSPWDIDVRNLRRSRELLSFTNVELTGVLNCRSHTLDFAARADLIVEQNEQHHPRRRSIMEIDFKSGAMNTSLSLVLGAEAIQGNAQQPADSNSAVPISHLTSKTLSESSAEVFAADVVQTTSGLTGTVKLNVAQLDALQGLKSGVAKELKAFSGSSSSSLEVQPQWIEFDVIGANYHDNRCTLRGELPAEAVLSMTLSVTQSLEASRLAYEQQLEAQVTTKREEIRSRIEKNTELAQQRLAEHRNSLVSMRSDLEKNPQFREGVAKLPGPASATR